VGWLKPEWIHASSGVADADRIVEAHRGQESNLIVEVDATVIRKLPDDEFGDVKQTFLVQLDNGHTLLVAHNVDIAPRVPVERGAQLRLAGEYDWNSRGGVIHWTHRDPDGEREGGWIRYGDRVYR
jgi:hypothetical protein